jgi:hypothetical protein
MITKTYIEISPMPDDYFEVYYGVDTFFNEKPDRIEATMLCVQEDVDAAIIELSKKILNMIKEYKNETNDG